MTDLRSRFAARFGEALAETIEWVAEHHTKVIPAVLDRGSDSFRFAIVWVVGFECLTRPEFRLEHGVTAPWADLLTWICDEADLAPRSTERWTSPAVAADCSTPSLARTLRPTSGLVSRLPRTGSWRRCRSLRRRRSGERCGESKTTQAHGLGRVDFKEGRLSAITERSGRPTARGWGCSFLGGLARTLREQQRPRPP